MAQARVVELRLVTADGPRPAKPGATDRIVAAVVDAIVGHRLMPGTRLVEQKLADLFDVSRTIVRQALNQLSRDGLVVLESARGAFVASPSVREAREVFAVRIMLETAMVRALAHQIGAADIAALRDHLRAEQRAVSHDDVPQRTRLLADFHIVLARVLGNQVLVQQLQDLLNRSSLITLMYQTSLGASHSSDDHLRIVDALERRDARAAARLMERHLRQVERNLQLEPRGCDLAQALTPNPGKKS
ncbi:MAG: GntR family transcriptional regulator [Burkholderiaceae bacterium]